MRRIFVLVLGLMGCVPGSDAFAADCTLKIVNTIPLTLAEDGARPLVSVTINGTPETFLLDTGGFATQISAAAAANLKLPSADAEVKMLDLYGHASTAAVHVDDFGLGRMHGKNTTFPVLPNVIGDKAPFVGILGPDFMGRYDVDLDFSGGKMNYFSPDHCEGKVVYWPAAATAIVPMRFLNRQLLLSVTLDGQTIRAQIDTGSPDTTLSAGTARRLFGVTADTPGVKVLAEDGGSKLLEYTFGKLAFEGLEVANPHIEILPDLVGSKDKNNNYVTGSRVQREDDQDPTGPVMLIGMNILSKLHIYIAFGENKIYMTPASAPAPGKQP